MLSIETIHAAALSELASSLSGICPTIDTYHGEVRDIIAQAAQMSISFPAALLLYDGSTFAMDANRSYTETHDIVVVFIARDLRGGSELKSGMHALLEAGKAALIDKNLGLSDISPLKPVQIRREVVTQTYSVYSLKLRTWFSL
jgi:hypothetical protein